MIIDNFLSKFEEFKQHCVQLDYSGVINPLDGVLYPGISVSIPETIKQQVYSKLYQIFGPVEFNIPLVVRLSTIDVIAPHQAHTDLMMGQYNFILYLNDSPDDVHLYGTSIVQHITGMDSNPTNKYEQQLWEQDTNEYHKWNIVSHCDMKQNRAFIVPSHLFHRAEPVSGFGTSPSTGRLVLLGFFNIL